MRNRLNLLPGILILITVLLSTGCSSNYAESGTVIIEAKEAIALAQNNGTLLIDAQTLKSYEKEHAPGAINISRADITKKGSVVNMLADAESIEEILSARGIKASDQLIIYDDNNNMDAARLWWTLLVYGHTNAKVVSGGLSALKSEGVSVTTEIPQLSKSNYTIQSKTEAYIATVDDVLNQVDYPVEGTYLLDTRTLEEYNAGTIPASILIDYAKNNYKDGRFQSIQNIRILYKEQGMVPDNTIIMYCKTSIRGAQTFLALYNAGYRNLKLYDGAWIEWVLDPSRPVQMPDTATKLISVQDNS